MYCKYVLCDNILLTHSRPFQLGSCPNAFEGCIPNVNCPWSANVMTSKCDSTAAVAAGVYSIYLTAKECCESHFYWDIDACLASPPSPPPTARPSVVEEQTPIDNIVGPQQIKPPPPDGDTVGILLAPIYIRFSNMQSQLQLDEEDREQLQDIIRRSLLVASDEFNITITSVDAVDSIFSNKDDQTISMSMYLKITITGEDVDPREVQIAFTNALQDQIYLIDNEINKSWGTASNNMILGIGSVETGGDVVSTRISNESSSSVPVWGIILIILSFAFLCGGLLVLQRRRLDNKGDSLPRHINESYREKSQPCEEGRYNPRDRQHISKRNQQHNRSFNQSQQTLTSRGGGGDEIIVPHNKPDPDGRLSFNKSMSFTQSALNINQEPIEQSSKRIESIQRKRSSGGGMRRGSSQEHDIQINRSSEREHMARGQEELEEEDGYDGGRSSFFITNDNYEGQESSDDSSEENNSSDDDVGVLGLMYYDGASSAGESLGAKESRLSRRSKRSAARSKMSTKSKASSRVSQSQQQPPPIARKKEVTKRKEQHQNITVDGQKDYPYVLQPPYNKRQSDHSDCPNIYIGGESSVVSGLSSTEEFNHNDTRTKFNKSSTILEELD